MVARDCEIAGMLKQEMFKVLLDTLPEDRDYILPQFDMLFYLN